MDLQPVCSVSLPQKQSQNWKLCIFCNKQSKTDLCKATQSGLNRFKEAFDIRKNHNDSSWRHLFERIQTTDIHEKTILWHKHCYASFTSRQNIDRLDKRSATAAPEQTDIVQPSLHNERTLRRKNSMNMDLCILCQKRKTLQRHEEAVVKVQTFNVAEKIRRIAMSDSTINCRLGTLEPIAAEVMYHKSCLKKYYNPQYVGTNKTDKNSIYDLAFAQLIQKIDEGFSKGQVYALTTLSEAFNSILLTMCADNSGYPNNLLLKRIVEHYGDSIDTASSTRRNESTYIFPKITITDAIQQIHNFLQTRCENPTLTNVEEIEEDQFMNRIFYHVSQKIKSDLKSSRGLNNVTELTKEAAKEIVPASLQILLNLILSENGKNPDDVENKVISIGQDIVYAYNNRNLTPKHIGIGLAIHQATRSRSLIDMVHAAGNCISYQTLMRIDTSLANHILRTFEINEKVFIPENLCKTQGGKHFIHFATDNIDILEETIDGQGTFHGTQLVAFQRGPSKIIDAKVALGRSNAVHDIPDELLKVDPAPDIRKPVIKVPVEVKKDVLVESQSKNSINSRDIIWLTCRSFAAKDQVIPSWTDMNKVLTQTCHQITTVGYTPIINYPAHELDTLVTVLNRCKDITKALGQKNTVLTCDEALYCKIKQIQWNNGNYNDVIVRLGGFHWVLNFLRVIGQHFASSGLSDIWVEAGIYGETTAQSIIDGKHYNRAIRALKLTADALWRTLFDNIKEWASEKGTFPEEILMEIETLGNCNEPSLELICKWDNLEQKSDTIYNLVKEFDAENKENQMYMFWRLYLDLAGIVLNFIRAEREGNWSMHLETVAQMLPWFFVYDHTNYARWGTIYLVDMQALSETANEVFVQFMKGNFVVKETGNSFNEKSPDQALEHINKVHKIAGGLVGITRKDTARDRWCLTFNYRSHLSEKGRKLFGVQHDETCEMTFSKNFQKDESDVLKLAETFRKIKLFDQTKTTLTNVYTGEIASDGIANDLMSARMRGFQLFEEFLVDRVIEKKTDFYNPLKRVKSKTFKHLHVANVTGRSGSKTNTVDTNMLVRHMFSAIKSKRQIDLNSIMKNELRDPPPSLFDTNGLIKQTPKAVLGNLIAEKSTFEAIKTHESNLKTATLIDGQALVQSIGKPKGAKTFGDLSDIIVKSIISNFKSNGCQSIHVLFDRYDQISIKSGTREKRRKSVIPIEQQVTGRESLLPVKWNRFIHSAQNKARLSDFLSKEIANQASKLESTQELLTSGGYQDALQVTTNAQRNIDHLRSIQEEADTRFVLHGIDCKLSGFDQLIVNCRDTDVLLLILHYYEQLPSVIWIKSGTNKKPKFIEVHDIIHNMTNNKRKSLLAYHSITGCDTTSALSGHTKKSSWPIFQKYYDLLANFGTTVEMTEDQLKKAEKFVILMYTNKKPGLQDLNNLDDLRAAMFQNIKELDKLPPTRESFRQHALRAHYQTFCWHNSDVAKPTLPAPTESGWKMEDKGFLVPVTSSANTISLKDLELISCQCKAGCRSSRCGCSAKKQKCLEGVCHVGYKCFNQFNFVNDIDQIDDDID